MTAAAGYGLVVLESVDSTNAEAQRRLQSGAQPPFAIRARVQTAGRGRRGRAWDTSLAAGAADNLALSIAIPLEAAEMARAPQIGFVAGLAAHDAIAAVTPDVPAQLKWPNDVMVEGRKLGGILLEACQAHGATSLIIGIGMNINAAPGDVGQPVTALAQPGRPLDVTNFTNLLLRSFDARLTGWRAAGFAPLRDEWLARAQSVGQEIEVRLERHIITGRFETLDESGRLLLRLADGGVEMISAGDIYPLVR